MSHWQIESRHYLTALLVMMVLTLTTSPVVFGQNMAEQMVPTELNIEASEHFIDVGGRQLHCKTYGSGSPTIVLISGLGAPQWNWNSIVPDLAELSTVFTYDRPGYGKSEMGSAPNHGLQAAADLKKLLEDAGVPTPYLLVGHSYGCRVARLFASYYPENVAGLILEDSQHEDILEAQKKVLSGKDLEAFETMVARMAPPENPKLEHEYTMVTADQIRNSPTLPDIPYTVLTSGDRRNRVPPIFSEEGQKRFADTTWVMVEKLASLIPNGKHLVVEGAGHIIHNDKPETVITEIREMVTTIRKSSSLY